MNINIIIEIKTGRVLVFIIIRINIFMVLIIYY